MQLPETPAQQIEDWRLKAGQERLKEAERIFWEVKNQVEREVRAEHPDWSREQMVFKIVRRLEVLAK